MDMSKNKKLKTVMLYLLLTFTIRLKCRRPTSQATIEKAYADINGEEKEAKVKTAAFLHRELERVTAQFKRLQAQAQELDVFLKRHPAVSLAGQELNEEFRRKLGAIPEDDEEEEDV